MFKYQREINGRPIAADFRRLLETGNMRKLTPRLYYVLTMHGGFIAHYNIDGFRATFDGKLTRLLHGESVRLTDPDRFTWPALEESGYKDGLSAGEVIRAIAAIASELEPMVIGRERAAARMAEIRHLRERYGVTLEVATALVNGSGAALRAEAAERQSQ